MIGSEEKYSTRGKADEYALMSWFEFGYNRLSEPFYSKVSELLATVAIHHIPTHGHIIEIGYGAGRVAYEVAKLRPRALVNGYEQSSQMQIVAHALVNGTDSYSIGQRSMAGKGLKNIHFSSGFDIQDLKKLASERADLVICVNVLDRVISPAQALNELYRITAHNGVIFIVSAFDYEDYTQKSERLSSDEIMGLMAGRGGNLLYTESLILEKLLNSGKTVKFNEKVVVMKKIIS